MSVVFLILAAMVFTGLVTILIDDWVGYGTTLLIVASVCTILLAMFLIETGG